MGIERCEGEVGNSEREGGRWEGEAGREEDEEERTGGVAGWIRVGNKCTRKATCN